LQFQSIRAADERVIFDRKLSVDKFKGAGRTYFAAAIKIIPGRKTVLEEDLIGIILVCAGAWAGDEKGQKQK
jgi:hypothetical protein